MLIFILIVGRQKEIVDIDWTVGKFIKQTVLPVVVHGQPS